MTKVTTHMLIQAEDTLTAIKQAVDSAQIYLATHEDFRAERRLLVAAERAERRLARRLRAYIPPLTILRK